MKIMLFSLLLFAASLPLSFANKFTLGLEGGPNIVSLSGTPNLDVMHTSRTFAAFSLQYSINPHFSLLSKIAYEQKGAKGYDSIIELDSMGTSSGVVTPYIRLNYFTLPLLLQYQIGKKIKYYGNAGCYFGYLIAEKDIAKGDNTQPITLYKGKAFTEPFDFGLSFGMGVS